MCERKFESLHQAYDVTGLQVAVDIDSNSANAKYLLWVFNFTVTVNCEASLPDRTVMHVPP